VLALSQLPKVLAPTDIATLRHFALGPLRRARAINQ
jgi:hypothetical protein